MKAKVTNKRGGFSRTPNVNPTNLTNKHWEGSQLAKIERMKNRMRKIEEKQKAQKMFFENKIVGYED